MWHEILNAHANFDYNKMGRAKMSTRAVGWLYVEPFLEVKRKIYKIFYAPSSGRSALGSGIMKPALVK